jgi:sulfide dehydrogenase cytochrome subunit
MTALATSGLILLAPNRASAEPLAPGAASCLACHRIRGDATNAAFPALGALSAPEIEAALIAYRSGRRDGTVMPRIAKGFSDVEARAIAESLARPEAAPR